MQESNKVRPDEFRVGDDVWCVLHGRGKVVRIDDVSINSVVVNFDTARFGCYLPSGKLSAFMQRTLFFSEPKIEASVTRPFVPTLVGKRVVVKLFSHLTEGTVCSETSCSFLLESGTSFSKQDVQAIYEISSENLLTSKK